MMPTPHKICSKCGEDKPLIEYYAHESTRDGLRPDCISCHKLSGAAYRAAHREEKSARNKAWRTAHPDQAKATAKKWHAAYPERCAMHRRRYKRTPAGKATDARGDAKRRMRKLDTDAAIALTAEEWQARIAEYGHHCCWCGKELTESEVTLDHIVALASGGAHVASNVAPSCRPCNSHKQAQDWGYPRPGIPQDELPEEGGEWL